MRIAIIQHNILSGSVEATLDRLSVLMNSAESSDVYVLSEMFATGFVVDDVSAPSHSQFIRQWMLQQAKLRNAAIVGSMAENDGNGKLLNRMYFITPEGEVQHYDKRHLFSFGGEDEHYSPGKERVIINFEGVRFLLQVCYDLRFPVFSRCRNDYDVAVYVAAWPKARISAWSTLLPARAVENQAYIVGVNRTGEDGSLKYNGCSEIIDYLGRPIVCVGSEEGGWTAEIDIDKQQKFRAKFPALADSDNFHIIL